MSQHATHDPRDPRRLDVDVTIRSASAEDTPRLHEIIARIYADYGDVLDVIREDPHLQDPGAYFRASGGELWVAEGRVDAAGQFAGAASTGAGEEAGRLLVGGSGGVVFREREAEIKTVYVAHEFRRRGLARRLVTLAMEHARTVKGARAKIMLWSDTRFVEAHALYESLGFVRGEVRHISITNTFSEYRYDLPR